MRKHDLHPIPAWAALREEDFHLRPTRKLPYDRRCGSRPLADGDTRRKDLCIRGTGICLKH
ncbi:MAG TPA: hypothetical protein VLG48_04725 [Candidatus Methylomirabilis sp.]|nr:hypothetical protein [Candidatus Methylomirabilis sp.]